MLQKCLITICIHFFLHVIWNVAWPIFGLDRADTGCWCCQKWIFNAYFDDGNLRVLVCNICDCFCCSEELFLCFFRTTSQIATTIHQVIAIPQDVRTTPQDIRTTPQVFRTIPQDIRTTPQVVRTTPQVVDYPTASYRLAHSPSVDDVRYLLSQQFLQYRNIVHCCSCVRWLGVASDFWISTTNMLLLFYVNYQLSLKF